MEAIKIQHLAHKLYLKKIPVLPSLLTRWIHFRYNSDIQPITKIGGGTKLGHGGIGVVIHKNAKIGRNCLLAQNVSVAGKDGGAPELKDWVYVGHASIILGNVVVGNNVSIGALSLVNQDVPDNAIVAGIPAKVIRFRSPEEVDEWHNWVIRNGGIPID